MTSKGKLPRIHDARHSFAVNALLRWYRMGADVDAKLPLLAQQRTIDYLGGTTELDVASLGGLRARLSVPRVSSQSTTAAMPD